MSNTHSGPVCVKLLIRQPQVALRVYHKKIGFEGGTGIENPTRIERRMFGELKRGRAPAGLAHLTVGTG
jgi:hypothetical protein